MRWLMKWLFGTRPTYRQAPPMRNPELVGLHMANAKTGSALR